jgi:O-antigen/teichoic acid export membrane protein
MGLTIPLALLVATDWALVMSWGCGSVLAACVALRLIAVRPANFYASYDWWKRHLWPYGRWLAVGGLFHGLVTYVAVLALIAILGSTAYGGLRAVQSLFAPLTLLAPALSLAGLPLVSRALRVSESRALLLASKLGLLLFLLTGMYVAVVAWAPALLRRAFGADFTQFESILVPIGVGQLLLACTFAFGLMLRAQRRGRALFLSVSLYTAVLALLSVFLAGQHGLKGAAWATVASALLFNAFLVATVKPHRFFNGSYSRSSTSRAQSFNPRPSGDR